MKKFNPNLYDILGRIDKDATHEEIKTAYRTLAKLYHTDINHTDSFANEERMKELNEAYEILKNPVKRAAYNAELLSHNEFLRQEEERKRKENEKRRQDSENRNKEKINRNFYGQNRQSMRKPIKASSAAKVGGVLLGVLALGLLIDALSGDD